MIQYLPKIYFIYQKILRHEYRLQNVLDSRDDLGAGVRVQIFFGLTSTTATYGFYEKDYQNIEDFREHMTDVFKVTTYNDKVRLT